MRGKRLGFFLLALVVAALASSGGFETIADLGRMFVGAPHDRYAARLRLGWISGGPAGRTWLESAEASLRSPRPVAVPRRDELVFPACAPHAIAFLVSLRRGQRLVAETDLARGGGSLFLDVFRRTDSKPDRVGEATGSEPRLELEIREDAAYILRAQPALGPDTIAVLRQHVEPTLRIPVHGASAANIRSTFGAPRDDGRRAHEGIDIFAARGTAVVAASDGIVSTVGTNRLGGNVVWVLRASRGEAHYYAHLDTHLVSVGARVEAGDVLGTVGNTGNARTTPPHLHFGIYAAGGAVDPLPYVAPPPPRGSSAAAMILGEEDP